MRHQIRAMLNELAEAGRLGVPASIEGDDEGHDAPSRHKARIPAKGASNLRKAQAALSDILSQRQN